MEMGIDMISWLLKEHRMFLISLFHEKTKLIVLQVFKWFLLSRKTHIKQNISGKPKTMTEENISRKP